jgi:hypothetical protein
MIETLLKMLKHKELSNEHVEQVPKLEFEESVDILGLSQAVPIKERIG